MQRWLSRCPCTFGESQSIDWHYHLRIKRFMRSRLKLRKILWTEARKLYTWFLKTTKCSRSPLGSRLFFLGLCSFFEWPFARQELVQVFLRPQGKEDQGRHRSDIQTSIVASESVSRFFSRKMSEIYIMELASIWFVEEYCFAQRENTFEVGKHTK